MMLACIYIYTDRTFPLVSSLALIGWSLIQHGFSPMETNLHRDSLAIDGCPKDDEGKPEEKQWNEWIVTVLQC